MGPLSFPFFAPSPLQDTPIPGSYHIRDFLEEARLNPVGKTYGFKARGREMQLLYVRKGDLLLPGAYSFTDSTQEALLRKTSYSFKNCPRPLNYTLGIRDKVGPNRAWQNAQGGSVEGGGERGEGGKG